MPALASLVMAAGCAILLVSALYTLITLIAALAWRLQRTPPAPATLPPVTLLKPLCGAEPGLYEHLRSFFVQDYPRFQIVFGVRDRADPACSVVEALCAEFPDQPVDVVIDPQLHGSNRKVSNLINMLRLARHELLAMADSDAFVGPDYLARVAAPLLDPTVGLVTCIYRGIPSGGLWSRLGAMYINEWYVPSVLLTWLFGYRGYVSGQTMCIRRGTLDAIGGLEAVANHLADDYRMGALVRGLGLRIILSPYVIRGEHYEPTMASLTGHEMRWMRTIRVLRPTSFRWIFLTFSLPLATIGILFTAAPGTPPPVAWTLLAITLAGRLVLHLVYRPRDGGAFLADLWLVPMRDVLLCWVWLRTFFTTRVTWRGQRFEVDADGLMRPHS